MHPPPGRPFCYDGIAATPGDKSEMVTLNPNHSHYICVDNGTEGAFGVEIAFRTELEAFISCYDYDARSLSLSDLTEYFSRCVDESSITVEGKIVDSGQPSHTIKLNDGGAQIDIVRTARDGVTKKKYSITVVHQGHQSSLDRCSVHIQSVIRGHLVRAKTARLNANISLARKRLLRLSKQSVALSRQSSVDGTNASGADGSTVIGSAIDGSDIIGLKMSGGSSFDFDPEKLAYTVRVPAERESITVTVTLATGTVPAVQCIVPTVILCYGGGPITLKVLQAAGAKPIIVVRGSLRAAKFVEDYISERPVDSRTLPA